MKTDVHLADTKGNYFGFLDAFGNSSGMKDELPIMF